MGIIPREVDEAGRIALTYSVVTGIKRTKQWDERGILCIIQVIATNKLAQFAYQQEYRFGFSTTGALDFGQCTQHLVDRRARPLPKPDEHHTMTLDLGDLHDICTLHEF